MQFEQWFLINILHLNNPISMQVGSVQRKYKDLPVLSDSQIQKLKQQQRTILFFEQLVIDASQFDHPGMKKTLKEACQLPSIKASFDKNKHSYNAKSILTQLTIGRKPQKTSTFGEQIFSQVQTQQITKIHSSIIENLDFTKPIVNQIQGLSQLQKEVFVMVPKFLKNSKSLKLKQNDKGWYINQYLYQKKFWVSTLLFFFCAIFLLIHSCLHQQNYLKISLWISFILGVQTWPLVEYYFHRILLHHNFCKKDGEITAHELHHAFPNHVPILSLSITHVGKYVIPIYAIIRTTVGHFQGVNFASGVLFAICAYDCLHYYFHFGPQINIWPINMLKKSHLKHHYRNPHLGFGVTNTIYDKLFGTDFSSQNLVKAINK